MWESGTLTVSGSDVEERTSDHPSMSADWQTSFSRRSGNTGFKTYALAFDIVISDGCNGAEGREAGEGWWLE